MGIQVVAKKEDLQEKGFDVHAEVEVVCNWNLPPDQLEHYLEVYGEPPSVEVARLIATSPDGEVVVSTAYRKDAVQFDNKDVNDDMREVLDKWKVPYDRW